MRDVSLRALPLLPLLVSSAALFGCGSAPAVSVARGATTEEIDGDAVKFKRGSQDAFAGARPGFYVVRNAEDWQQAWPADKVPPSPAILDTSSNMLLFAVEGRADIAQVKVQRAVETHSYVYVWVKETKLGENCLAKSADHAFDAVVTPRADKPVKFFVEEESGESCGAPPVAKVECRQRNDKTWSSKLTAQPGDALECTLSAQAQGKFELVDRSMTMGALPSGSTSKLAFRKGPDRAELEVDVYGTYTVLAEAADEIGRRGKGSATIDVKPPKTKDVLVQLVWAGFDRVDDPDTFPRANLRIAEEGPKGQRCTAELPIPGLCDVKTRGAYTYMRIPEGERKLPISIQFLDERFEKGPGPCVHVWFDGARTAEICDKSHRNADEIWQLGVLDTTTGLISDPPPPDTAATAPAKPPPPKKKKTTTTTTTK